VKLRASPRWLPLQLGINLDPLSNGHGGVDHGVLLQAATVPDINYKNGLLRFGRGLSMDAVVYWQVCLGCGGEHEGVPGIEWYMLRAAGAHAVHAHVC
jgi:hypothetical protein